MLVPTKYFSLDNIIQFSIRDDLVVLEINVLLVI